MNIESPCLGLFYFWLKRLCSLFYSEWYNFGAGSNKFFCTFGIMNNGTIYSRIRETVQFCLPGSRIVLFGSRARGDYDSFSDYDLLIVTPTTFDAQDKIQWSSRLDRAIVEAIQAPVDILFHSEEEVRQKQELPGNIIRSAIREGVAL